MSGIIYKQYSMLLSNSVVTIKEEARKTIMEAEGLHLNIDYVGSSGVILSTEQKAAFQSSLVILKNNYKFKRVLFWGKILGVKDDYFIVEGIRKDELRDRQILYSVDCVKWGLLPQVTEEMRQNCSFVKGRFTGDPSYEYEHTETKRNEDRDSDPDQDEETTVSLVIAWVYIEINCLAPN
ncbi:radial spoke head 9 homolog [Paramuricea clavata]|uniref:Radial spoke head protein 9 homolog n=1 Tax=Paramuricea clavata TaxID=317549 RepID=A0A6S7IBH2_PARCT|nr:radial spoke head 9 homolog [Paramuricea clavata]